MLSCTNLTFLSDAVLHKIIILSDAILHKFKLFVGCCPAYNNHSFLWDAVQHKFNFFVMLSCTNFNFLFDVGMHKIIIIFVGWWCPAQIHIFLSDAVLHKIIILSDAILHKFKLFVGCCPVQYNNHFVRCCPAQI